MFVASADGKQPPRPIVNLDGSSESPAWSAQNIIGFEQHAADGSSRIYTVNPRTGEAKAISPAGADAEHPVWSPTGRYLAYEQKAANGEWQIWIAYVAVNQAPALLPNQTTSNQSVAWSSNGALIAYRGVKAGKSDLYVVNQSGTFVKQLTTSGTVTGGVAWSSDNARLAYTETDSNGHSQIGVANALAAKPAPTMLTNGTTDAVQPTWNCSGTQIYYSAPLNGQPQLFSVSINGGQTQALGQNGSDPVFNSPRNK